MTNQRHYRIIGAFDATISKFLYYHRKEDEILPVGAIEKAIVDGEVTINELCMKLFTTLHEAAKIPIPKLPETVTTMTCAYCGYAYPEGTPATQHEKLSEHIKTCAKHPLREAEAKIKNLTHLLRQVYHHASNVTGERFSEHLMDVNIKLAKDVSLAIGDTQP